MWMQDLRSYQHNPPQSLISDKSNDCDALKLLENNSWASTLMLNQLLISSIFTRVKRKSNMLTLYKA